MYNKIMIYDRSKQLYLANEKFTNLNSVNVVAALWNVLLWKFRRSPSCYGQLSRSEGRKQRASPRGFARVLSADVTVRRAQNQSADCYQILPRTQVSWWWILFQQWKGLSTQSASEDSIFSCNTSRLPVFPIYLTTTFITSDHGKFQWRKQICYVLNVKRAILTD